MKIEMDAVVFNGISKLISSSILKSLEEAGKVYGFDGAEEFKRQDFEVIVKKKSSSKKTKVTQDKKDILVLPFEKAHVNYDLCQGIVYNKGLFTQCKKDRLENGKYCKNCQKEACESDECEPLCGNVDKRLYYGLYDYKDKKGRSPKNYGQFIAKLGLNAADIEARALSEFNITISPEHFLEPEKKDTTRRGRPKKETVPIESKEVSDLFMELTKSAGDEPMEYSDNEENIDLDEDEDEKVNNAKKEQEKLQKEQEKLQKEQEKLQKEQEKKERESKKEAEKLQKEAEKKQKKEAEKLQKEAEKKQKKEAERLQKEQEKLQKEAEKKQKKEEKKKEKKEEKKKEKKEEEKAPTTEEKAPTTEEKAPTTAQKMVVCRIQIDKKTYFLNRDTKILFDLDTREPVGIWNEEKNIIEDLPEDEEDEEEEVSECDSTELDSDLELDSDDYN
jgi:hypothetical protein